MESRNQQAQSRIKLLALGGALLAILTLSKTSARSESSYQQAVRLFNTHNYQAATPLLETVTRSSPSDSNAYYYLALSYHYQGNYPKAKRAYAQIVSKFPGTRAAQLAAYALRQLNTSLPAQRQGSSAIWSSASGSSMERPLWGGAQDLASLPEQSKVYFTRHGNSLIIDAELNNRRIPMVFDTGAEATVFGKNHLQQLGITPPTGQPTGLSYGVGSNRPMATWMMTTELKVGSIQRHNFPITVQESLPTYPLLGQSFFHDFQYTIDNGANSITFTRKSSTSSSNSDNYSVPFRREGNELVVRVEINGRQCEMYFDTGADAISFSRHDLDRLGIPVPEDAEVGLATGIGGTTTDYRFTVSRMRMGPVDKSNVEVHMVTASQMGKPLLGQTFYRDWQYTIDNDHRVIHFVRR